MLITSLIYHTRVFYQPNVSTLLLLLKEEATPEHLLSNSDRKVLQLIGSDADSSYRVPDYYRGGTGPDGAPANRFASLTGPCGVGPNGEVGPIGPQCPGARGAAGAPLVIDEDDPYLSTMVAAAFDAEGGVSGTVDDSGNLTINDGKTSRTIPVEEITGGADGGH